MSRTFRAIETWRIGITNFDRTWAGIYPDQEGWRLKWDDRDRAANGYDQKSKSCLYGFDNLKENNSGRHRKFIKRFYHRRRRSRDRRETREMLETQWVDTEIQTA